MVDETVKAFGRLDIMVNNAGLQHVSPITEFPEERWETLIGVILTGSFLCTKYALPHMIRNKWGRVINISSTQGKVATPFKVGYVAAKRGVLGLTETVTIEVAEHNITVNAICPAFARTPLVEKQIAANAREHGISEAEVIEKLMTGPAAIHRLLEPSEIASLALYLCSDRGRGMQATRSTSTADGPRGDEVQFLASAAALAKRLQALGACAPVAQNHRRVLFRSQWASLLGAYLVRGLDTILRRSIGTTPLPELNSLNGGSKAFMGNQPNP